MLITICLITNQSIPNAINDILNKKMSSKEYKVELIKEFITQERHKDSNIGFLAPENNYIHWKLDESRYGFPQKAIFRNIAKGKMDSLTTQQDKVYYKFLLPSEKDLCQTLNNNAPKFIITKNNDYSYNCLKQRTSKYNLLSETQILNDNDIYIFKRFNE